jgi:hypothetical protein
MARVGAAPGRGEDGFGLVEVLVSLSVLLVVMIASSYLVDNIVQQAAVNRQKVAAAELAEQYLETTSNATLASLQSNIARDVLLTPTPVTVGSINYSVWSHLEWADTGAQTKSLCSSGNPPQVIRATMTVKWGNGLSLGETSIINPPYGTVIPGDGFLSIQILGAAAPKPPADTTNLINVAVNVTPQSTGVTTTYNPDQNGCVYLQEPVGQYNISLASPTGGPTFIDWQDQAVVDLTPSQTGVSVATVGLPAFVPAFHYDEAGTVTMSPSASAPVASGLPISVSNGGNLQPTGTQTIVAYSTSATSIQLFPYTTAYSVWYGDCTTTAGVTKEQPTAPTTFTLSPQGSATASITGLDTLAITATRSGGAAFSAPPTATVTINDAAAPGDGCPAVDKTGGEVFALVGYSPTTAGSTTSYTSQTAIIAQTYTVTVHDPSNNSNTPFAMVVGPTGVTYGGTTYPYGTAVPVVVS